MHQAEGKKIINIHCWVYIMGAQLFTSALQAIDVPKYKSCQLCSLIFPTCWLRKERWEDCVEVAHIGNEQSNQDEVKIKLQETQLPLMNTCLWHTLTMKSSLLPSHSISDLPLRSCHHPCYFSPFLPSLPPTPLFFFHVIIPLLLWDRWSPQRDCGMLEEYESNRCLITVLIAGHRETHTHTHTCYSDKQWQRW